MVKGSSVGGPFAMLGLKGVVAIAVLDNFVRISRGELKRKDEKRIKRALTFRPQPDVQVWVYRERASTGELWLPRGALSLLPSYVRVQDRRSYPKLDRFDPEIVLDYKSANKSFEGQRECVDEMFQEKQGVIHRQPGTGKTQIALYFIATVGTRTLVIVHTEDILQQWLDYAKVAIPGMEIGVIRQKTEDVRQLTIATVQTLVRRNYKTEWWRQFGCTILDECHHAPAKTFDRIIAHSTSRYRFGLSASKTRADRMEPLVEFNFGPTIHEQDFASPVPVTVEKVKTKFKAQHAVTGPMWLRRKRWHGLIDRLTNDPARNALIAKRVGAKLDEGRSVLVLSRRINHLQNLQESLTARGHDSVILAAQLVSKPERREVLRRFREGEVKCVLATQLADEALDVPILSCIALTFPAKHTDLILQQVGRALREHPEKGSVVIIDIVDPEIKSLRSQWHGRRGAYLRWGFKIKGSGIYGRFGGRAHLVRKAATRRLPKRRPQLGRVR